MGNSNFVVFSCVMAKRWAYMAGAARVAPEILVTLPVSRETILRRKTEYFAEISHFLVTC